MIQFIETLSRKEQKIFDTQQLPGLCDMLQKAFNCLSLAYTTASVTDPDLISNKSEETREVLAWLDDQLFDLRQRKEENEQRQAAKSGMEATDEHS